MSTAPLESPCSASLDGEPCEGAQSEGGGCLNPKASTSEEAHEPCPTPLSWQQVLSAFHDESTSWQLDNGDVTINGRTWASGPPLYFLNGISGTCDLYALSGWLLREDFRCVFFDYNTPSKPCRELADVADDLISIADHHGDERFQLYASDFGAAVAMTTMASFPERVERAVLQSAFIRRRWTMFEKLLLKIGLSKSKTMSAVPGFRIVNAQNHRPWFPPFDFGRWQFFAENCGATPVQEVAARARMLGQFDLTANLPEITQPTFLVYSEGVGKLVIDAQKKLEAGLSNVESEWLHTCGQLPYLTHPHRLTKMIIPFLQGALSDQVTDCEAAHAN